MDDDIDACGGWKWWSVAVAIAIAMIGITWVRSHGRSDEPRGDETAAHRATLALELELEAVRATEIDVAFRSGVREVLAKRPLMSESCRVDASTLALSVIEPDEGPSPPRLANLTREAVIEGRAALVRGDDLKTVPSEASVRYELVLGVTRRQSGMLVGRAALWDMMAQRVVCAADVAVTNADASAIERVVRQELRAIDERATRAVIVEG
ncbi:MAG: hypothetical protein ABI867_33835 [Kofleriaceae bacterium]